MPNELPARGRAIVAAEAVLARRNRAWRRSNRLRCLAGGGEPADVARALAHAADGTRRDGAARTIVNAFAAIVEPPDAGDSDVN